MRESITRYCWDEDKQVFILGTVMEANLRIKAQQQEAQHGAYIRGPIPMDWLEQAAKLSGKTLNAALAIWYVHSVTKKFSFTIKRQTWERLQLTRQTYYRALRDLENSGLIAVERRPGAYPLITLHIAGNQDPVSTNAPDRGVDD